MKKTDSRFKKIAVEAARLGDAKHAENIVVYELAESSTLADYAVVMSAGSTPQLEAAEDAVSKAFKERGLYVLHREGGDSRAWKILDYGGVLVHIFETGAREFYSLDVLYSAFPQVSWKKAASRPAAAKKSGPAARRARTGKSIKKGVVHRKKPRTARKK